MTDTALGASVTRLERAIGRLERTARAPAGEGELQARHARLRDQVREAIGRLDALIGDA